MLLLRFTLELLRLGLRRRVRVCAPSCAREASTFARTRLRLWADNFVTHTFWIHYIQSEYFPAYLPFMLLTGSFAAMMISACVYITEKFPTHTLITTLAQSGRMSLSCYVFHITVGMLLFTLISQQTYTGLLTRQIPATPVFIGIYATVFYLFCIALSILWNRKFTQGPLEICMRKFSG